MTYVEAIKRTVAQEFRCQVAALSAQTREEPIATARLVAMALCRALTGLGKSDIAAAFGRSGSMVPTSVVSVRNRMAVDSQFASRVEDLRAKCELAVASAKAPKFVRRRAPRFTPARRLSLAIPVSQQSLAIERLVGCCTQSV